MRSGGRVSTLAFARVTFGVRLLRIRQKGSGFSVKYFPFATPRMIRAEHVGQSRWRPSRGQVRTSFILQRRIGAQDVGMARELRLEFHGTFYHIINRGNYRHHVFGPAGVQIAFETCLSRPARSRVGCCTRLWSWATTTTSQWKRGRPILRSPVPFFIQNQPTLPVGRQLRPTDSSRISQSRFLGGV